jgi:hypothetical protein
VRPNGDFDEAEVRRLIIRRHRHSTEVAEAVGSDWAPRQEPNHRLVTASAEENAVAAELVDSWLHPTGSSPYSGRNGSLFPWTLAKAFLSSPEALLETIRQRIRRLPTTQEGTREKNALKHLEELASAVETSKSAKYRALVEHAKSAGVGPRSATRIVVFAERVPTLKALESSLPKALGLPKDAVAVLHGGLTDEEQQEVVESFKLESSPIRVLVTGDIASEGVNLHAQCHELVHFDIPWSLIRIEQRNGRIDRYGQKQAPRITTLLLSPDNERFTGDFRVLTRLLEREEEAHNALGDTASLMGKHSVQAEEDEIMRAISAQQDIDEVVRSVDQVQAGDDFDAFWATWETLAPTQEDEPNSVGRGTSAALFPSDVDFLSEALEQAYTEPGKSLAGGGVGWRNHGNEGIVELTPPADLAQRLAVLPQSYLEERKVTSSLKLAVTPARGNDRLLAARSGTETNQWPDAHFLGPLHPVLDWASDRSLAKLGRGTIFAVRGTVEDPVIALLGTLTNGRGQVVAASHMTAVFGGFPHSTACLIQPFGSAPELYHSLGLTTTLINPGPVDIGELTPLVRPAVEAARGALDGLVDAASRDTSERVQRWATRVGAWESDASALVQRKDLRERRMTVEAERRLAEAMKPSRRLVRPLLVVVPADWPVARTSEGAL